jgi:nucleotide-binding universal stress UspA family protein
MLADNGHGGRDLGARRVEPMSVDPLKTVVVGCDGSWHSHCAVTAATGEAVRRHSELVVLSVPTMRERRPHRLVDVAGCEQEALSSAADRARRGVDWAREIDPAVSARALVAALDAPVLTALLADTEMLVLGGHGRGGQRAFSLGSTSRQLAHAVAAPLLLAAPDGPLGADGQEPTVVVGLDGQPWSKQALVHAVAQADLRGATLVVVRAVLPGHPDIEAAVARARRDCAAALEDVSPGPVTAAVVVTVAPVLEALVDACTSNALLVLGNRGSGRLRGPVPGSLTQRLTEAVRCDVVLVPSPVAEDRTVDGSVAVPHPA